tara:strand:+ start:1181 stop:1372 length:192 start_codon:yes stop_codon:yes gene_type:complete
MKTEWNKIQKLKRLLKELEQLNAKKPIRTSKETKERITELKQLLTDNKIQILTKKNNHENRSS